MPTDAPYGSFRLPTLSKYHLLVELMYRWRSASRASIPGSQHTTRIPTSPTECLYLHTAIKPLYCFIRDLTIFVQLDIYHVLIYLQLYLVLLYFVYLLISLTIFVHLHGFITLVPILLRLLSGVSMTKSGQIKSKSDKSIKFFLDFADVSLHMRAVGDMAISRRLACNCS